MPGSTELDRAQVFPGDKAFKLYDTFGLPLDFMQDAARDQGIDFDQAGFDRAMEEQRDACSRLLERRRQADRQSGLPAASEIRVRRLPPDSIRRLRGSRHHSQRPGVQQLSRAKKAK